MKRFIILLEVRTHCNGSPSFTNLFDIVLFIQANTIYSTVILLGLYCATNIYIYIIDNTRILIYNKV